jgi:hypothetical protein
MQSPREAEMARHNYNVTFWCSYARDRILEEWNSDT